MNSSIERKKVLLRIVSVGVIAVVLYLGWTGFVEGFKDGYNSIPK